MAAFYLLQENGDKIILEQGGGFLLLEQGGLPATSVIYGGDDAPQTRKKRRTYHDLFHEIEATIHALVSPPDQAPAVEPEVDSPRRAHVEEAIDELVRLAEGQHALLQQAASLRAELAQWEANRQRLIAEDEAEWEWFL